MVPRRPPAGEGPGLRRDGRGHTLTAPFLKSLCFEIGSVASSGTLLMS